MYELKNILKTYGTKTVLSIDKLIIKDKNITAISGPNGSGKSTLLEILAGIQKPTEGQIQFKNKNIVKRKPGQVIIILQNPIMFNTSVYSNIAFGLKVKKTDKKTIKQKIEAVLVLVNLNGFAKQNARTLSGGEKQRLAIARALVLEPDIILMDEPTSGLDVQAKEQLKKTIKTIHKDKKIDFIIASHDTEFLFQTATDAFSLLNGQQAPVSVENLFSGVINANGNFIIDSGVEMTLSTFKRGKANILIFPENIVLSKHLLKSSMTNVFKGEVIKLIKFDNEIKVWVDIGIELCCKITPISLKKMQITIADNIFVEFKATAIKVY